MFELYKSRDFSANFSDTTDFFKTFGKHYFKNYLVINGVFLAILVVLIYFFSKVYSGMISSGFNSLNNSIVLFDYLNNNPVFLVVGLIALVFFILFLSFLTLCYPIVYLKLFEKNNNDEFTLEEIVNELKSNIGKMFYFALGSIFVILPILLILCGILFLLCFILIGIPLLFIVFFAFISWIYLSFYEYFSKNVGFISALLEGFKLLKQKFWSTLFTTFLLILMVQIIQGCFSIIPLLVDGVGIFTSTENQLDGLNSTGIFGSIMMVVSVIVGYFLNNFVIINQGLIYYGLKEEKNNHSTKSQIDLIGTDIE